MGLRKKTFLYSVVLAVIMIAFIIGYFVLMLPSLYVDYVMNSNLESVVEIQRGRRLGERGRKQRFRERLGGVCRTVAEQI